METYSRRARGWIVLTGALASWALLLGAGYAVVASVSWVLS